LNIIGTLDKPSKGSVFYEGKTLDEVGKLHLFRRDFIGYIFQFHHLIPVLSLRENVESALLSHKDMKADERYERAVSLLKEMGLQNRLDSFASEVSGGERQRGAIARALVNNPKVILADEPTGNIDSKTTQMILKKLQAYIKDTGKCVLIATHDSDVADIADTVIQMKDGKIISIINK
jgi:ABC-type lipoprotein export system ATPase subunit